LKKNERLREFIKRLCETDSCGSSEEAFETLTNVLNEVEDELSNIPYSPDQWMTDGRMYPPQDDSRRSTLNSEVVRYRNKGHNTYIGSNGSIKIEAINGNIIIDKAGRDGRKIGNL